MHVVSVPGNPVSFISTCSLVVSILESYCWHNAALEALTEPHLYQLEAALAAVA